MSLAMNIIDLAVSEARKAGAERITAIDLEVGEVAGVLTESLLFCFNAASRNTPAEDASLNITDVPAERKCLSCKNRFAAQGYITMCPVCESGHTVLISGQELVVKSIVVAD